MVHHGKFIEIEGLDGSGKTTQAKLLSDRLGAVLVREPGGTVLGESIRDLLLAQRTGAISHRAEALLFMAARAQLVDAVIDPALRGGEHVVADRFSESTFAYQGYGRGLDMSALITVNNWAVGNVTPDVIVYIDVPNDELQRRIEKRHKDRMEADRHLLEGARRYFDKGPQDRLDWVIVDGNGSTEEVAERMYKAVMARLQEDG